jgi:hypothetical protein
MLFLLLCAGLAAVIYFEAQQGTTEPAVTAAAQQATPPPERTHQRDPTFITRSVNSFAEGVAQPLFSPTQRPPLAPTDNRRGDFKVVGRPTQLNRLRPGDPVCNTEIPTLRPQRHERGLVPFVA